MRQWEDAGVVGLGLSGSAAGEGLQNGGDVLIRRRLVGGQAHMVGVEQAEVVSALLGARDGLFGAARHDDAEGVEEVLVLDGELCVQDPGGDARRLGVGVIGNAPQPLRAVVDGVEGGHHREQCLSGADVGGRLLPSDVLLAGLKRQAERLVALAVPRDADDAAGNLPAELIADRHEAGVRTAEEERHAESLSAADGDIGTGGAGLLQQGQGQRVGIDGDEAAAAMHRCDRAVQVLNRPARGRMRQDGSQQLLPGILGAVLNSRRLGRQGMNPERSAAGQRHLEALGVQAGVQQNRAAGGRAGGPSHEQDRLCDGSGLVQQRGACHRQTGEVADQRLEEELRLKAPLADLRLVGRVRGRPGRVAQDIAGNDGGCVRGVVPASDHLDVRIVEGGQRPQGLNGLRLGEAAGGGGRAMLARRQDRQSGGYDGGRQVLELVQAQCAEHGILIVARGADVAQDEGDVGNVASSSHEDLRYGHEPAHILGDGFGSSWTSAPRRWRVRLAVSGETGCRCRRSGLDGAGTAERGSLYTARR